MLMNEARPVPHWIRLQELNLDVSTEALLSAERAFTYADLHAVLGNDDETLVAWLTPHAFVARALLNVLPGEWIEIRGMCDFNFSVDGDGMIVFALSPEHLVEICDVLLRLLAASVLHSVLLNKLRPSDSVAIDAPSLAHLMEQCKSLKVLRLRNLKLDEHHCRVLGAYSRPDLEIALYSCTLTSAGTSALADILERNQGPTELDSCDIDYSALADGLRGNSRLKSFRKSFRRDFSDYFDAEDSDVVSSDVVGSRQVLAIANALRENKGLVELELRSYNFFMNDETWGAICDSLKTHPTLEVLNLRGEYQAVLDVITSRVQALVDMMKVNTSIYTIQVDRCYSETEMYRESVIPYLETNWLRPRLLAIQKTRPTTYRAKVLGRALVFTHNHPNTFWMLLVGNAEVAFPSRTTTIAVVENIPTPAAAALPSALTTTVAGILSTATTAIATRDASIPSSTSSLDAFTSTPYATAATGVNAASLSAGQKRKASP
jgi:hypothetical protein